MRLYLWRQHWFSAANIEWRFIFMVNVVFLNFEFRVLETMIAVRHSRRYFFFLFFGACSPIWHQWWLQQIGRDSACQCFFPIIFIEQPIFLASMCFQRWSPLWLSLVHEKQNRTLRVLQRAVWVKVLNQFGRHLAIRFEQGLQHKRELGHILMSKDYQRFSLVHNDL